MKYNLHSRGTKITDIDLNGRVIFIYSDKYNIFFFLLDFDVKKMYKITTDKSFVIENIDDVSIPDNFFNYERIKFFKPLNNYSKPNNGYIYTGIITYTEISYKFTIMDDNIFTESNTITVVKKKEPIDDLKCIEDFDIYCYIQKKDIVYAVGYDKRYDAYSYITVNIEKDKLKRVYSLNSEYGDILPLTLSIDPDEGMVYIGGNLAFYSSPTLVKPYIECFLMT
jgi:hypothetical protein